MTQPIAPTPLDRILRAFRALVRAEDPNRTFGFGPWEYQVQRADGSTFDGSPTEQSLPLPPVTNVPYRGSLAGTTCVPAEGALAYVAFVNADPSRPIVVGWGPCPPASGAQTAAPSAIRIDASIVTVGDPAGSPHPAARMTDSIAGGSFSALGVTPGSPIQFVYTPYGGVPLPPGPNVTISGQITSGSSKLQSE